MYYCAIIDRSPLYERIGDAMRRFIPVFLAVLSVVSATTATGCAQDNRPPCATVSVNASDIMPGYYDDESEPIELLGVDVKFSEEFGFADRLNVVEGNNVYQLMIPPIENNHVKMYLPKGANIVMINDDGLMSSEACKNSFVVE